MTYADKFNGEFDHAINDALAIDVEAEYALMHEHESETQDSHVRAERFENPADHVFGERPSA